MTVEEIVQRLYSNRGPRGYPSQDEVASAVRHAFLEGKVVIDTPPQKTGPTDRAAFIAGLRLIEQRDPGGFVQTCGDAIQARCKPLMPADEERLAGWGWRMRVDESDDEWTIWEWE